MHHSSNPDQKKFCYHEEKARHQKTMELWRAEQAAKPPIEFEMTDEDYKLALEKYGPLYEKVYGSDERPSLFPPSLNSKLENMN